MVEDDFFLFLMVLCTAAMIFTISVLIVSTPPSATRNVQVCEITTTDTGSVERCWDEKFE